MQDKIKTEYLKISNVISTKILLKSREMGIIVLLVFILLLSVGEEVFGKTKAREGSKENPYVISEEYELRDIVKEEQYNDYWTFIAINGNISITKPLHFKSGKFVINSYYGNYKIKRSTKLNAAVNDKDNPKYCIQIEDTAYVVFGDQDATGVLTLDGSRGSFNNRQCAGWMNVAKKGLATIESKCKLVNVNNSETVSNSAAIRSYGTLRINGEISNCSGLNGGAIKATDGVVYIYKDTYIHNCTSQTEGGAIYVSQGATLEQYGGIISNCSSKEEGGGIFITNGARGNIVCGTIANNSAGASAGGIFSGYGADLIIGCSDTGPDIYGNRASGSGGGVRCDGGEGANAGGSAHFYYGKIYGNYAGKFGGGIACGAPYVTMKSRIYIYNMNIYSNTSEGDGGGIWLADESLGFNAFDPIFITDCYVSNNKSNGNGGGIMAHSKIISRNNQVNSNNCTKNGGGIYIHDNARLELYSGEISENNAQGVGGGVHVRGQFWIAENGFVKDNNRVYLVAGTYIDIVGKLYKSSGYIACIESAKKDIGTKLIHVSYDGSDGEQELYYEGNANREYTTMPVIKKYNYYNSNAGEILRPTKRVNGYDDKWIILSKRYDIKYDANTKDEVQYLPMAGKKFWHENTSASTVVIVRKGYKTNEKKHWNIKADGTGERIKPADIITEDRDITLYAQWVGTDPKKLFINAEDRYYMVGQNILLTNYEVLKKVHIFDDINSNNKYVADVIKITDGKGMVLSNGVNTSIQNIMSTSKVGSYKLTIYAKSDKDKIYMQKDMNVFILDSPQQINGVRYISKGYINTLVTTSKWMKELKNKLYTTLDKSEGQGRYVIKLTDKKIKQIKSNLKEKGYIINHDMNVELAKEW